MRAADRAELKPLAPAGSPSPIARRRYPQTMNRESKQVDDTSRLESGQWLNGSLAASSDRDEQRTRSSDPKLPFEVGPRNCRYAPESGLRPNASVARIAFWAERVNPEKRLGHRAEGRLKRRTAHERNAEPRAAEVANNPPNEGIGAVCADPSLVGDRRKSVPSVQWLR
jgi:hypothetical protein